MKKILFFLSITTFILFTSGCTPKEPIFNVNLLEDNTYEITSLQNKSQFKEIIIPEKINDIQVTSIGELAFENQKKLNKLTLPEGLIYIKDRAFVNCTSLQNITTPSTLKSLGYGAFESCTSLSQVNLNEGIFEIKGSAFANCTSLTEFDLPNTLTSLGVDVLEPL